MTPPPSSRCASDAGKIRPADAAPFGWWYRGDCGWRGAIFFWFALLLIEPVGGARAATLATLEYRLTGSTLTVSPAVLSVPKGIAGSLAVTLSGPAALRDGAVIEGILRGPSLPPRKLLAAPGEPLLLPPLPVVGDYQIDNVRLVDGLTGQVRLESVPSTVPVHVFDQVLVSQVTARSLTTEEIREKGIAIDEKNFRVTEFEVGFVLDGQTISVRLPVVAPRASQTTEIIPAAELEARLRQAAQLNQDLTSATRLPAALAVTGIELKGIDFQATEDLDEDLALRVPPIPALLLIPGNIGFLNQFFSVQIFTENAAPSGSGLSVRNIRAELILPDGTDQTPGTYEHPGDDPLRLARLGPDRQVQPIQSVVRPGADGTLGTADDVPRLLPGETGQAEFLVEGLQEGLHVMNLQLTGELEGLAAGVIHITGKAAGAVLVRNPKFSLAFTHPRTVRTGEPYEATVTILNTASSPANLLSVTLPAAAISGAVLESDASVELGTLRPGQSATARFRLHAQRTGQITFSNLTVGEDATAGRFHLTMGVDERGVDLSPDSLAMPAEAGRLPRSLLVAAERVLGQALSAATAPVVPGGVRRPAKDLIRSRILELAEAGQRLFYGDGLARVVPDLLLDWQGGRIYDDGFDQILRETDAGAQWRAAVAGVLESGAAGDAVERLRARAADLAGRGENWTLIADTLSGTNRAAALSTAVGRATADRSEVPGLLAYRGLSGAWWVVRGELAGEWESLPIAGTPGVDAPGTIAYLRLSADGTGAQWDWSIRALHAADCLRLKATPATDPNLTVDADCLGTSLASLAAVRSAVRELPPGIVGVRQDPTVLAGRPARPCIGPDSILNYGTVIAVLFSKPMVQATLNQPAGYQLDGGVTAQSVQIQPSGRLALVNLRQGISAIRPRTLRVMGITDPRGLAVDSAPASIVSEFDLEPFRAGVAVQGRVVRADGSVAAGIPVTLLMQDRASSGEECVPADFRVSQVLTDSAGNFGFDFILAGVPYMIGATDTSGLSPEALAAILAIGAGTGTVRQQLTALSGSNPDSLLAAFSAGALPQAIAKAEGLDRATLKDLVELGSAREGGTNFVALRFRGRGTVTGTVLAGDGRTPVPNVAVNLYPDPASRELGRGLFTDAAGRFAFFGVPLGDFTLTAATGGALSRTLAGALVRPGEVQDLPVVLSAAVRRRGALIGRVTEADLQTPHGGATVYVGHKDGQKIIGVVATVTTDGDGQWAASELPEDSYDVVAVSRDAQRQGESLGAPVSPGNANRVTVALPGFGVVAGRVMTVAGTPVADALVAGGLGTTRTGPDGRFLLSEVPTGRRTLSTGVEATHPGELPRSSPEFPFPRQGSVTLDVLPGVLNVADITLTPAGVVRGTVRDAAGRPVTGLRVAKPVEGGFLHVPVDANGVFVFEGLALGPHVLSAPAPPSENTDVSGITAVLADAGSSAATVQAALKDAFALFTGAADPLINGTGAAFDPESFGFSNAEIRSDGEVVSADIRFFRRGTVAGIVKNGQDIPVGARVRLTGLGASPNGAPTLRLRSADLNSDPATGEFSFPERLFFGRAEGPAVPGQIVPGIFGLQAATPFSPTVVSLGGLLTIDQPEQIHVVLQFPGPRVSQGRIAGRVLNPDGSPAAAGVQILVPIEGGFSPADFRRGFQVGDIHNPVTQEVGAEIIPGLRAVPPEFPPMALLNALGADGTVGVTYPVVAHDRASGLLGLANVLVLPGRTNPVTVRLLGQGGLRVRVVGANGSAIQNATVTVTAAAFPFGQFAGVTGGAGESSLGNLFENTYAVSAEISQGSARIFGRATVQVVRGTTAEVMVSLQATATLVGRFLERDRFTPVANAPVQVGPLGFAATADDGSFSITGLPLGNYRLTGVNPVTGAAAFLDVLLSSDGEVRRVELVEPSRGEIAGSVVASLGTAAVPGVEVSLRFNDGFQTPRVTTTDPSGQFRFPGAPAGGFTLQAVEPLRQIMGFASGVLPPSSSRVELDVHLEPRANVLVRVFEPTGNPATNARVVLSFGNGAQGLGVDETGRVRFELIPFGSIQVFARDTGRAGSRSVAGKSLVLSSVGDIPEIRLDLGGTGQLTGRVFLSDGVTPVPAGTVVKLEPLSALLTGEEENAATDASGRYLFTNVGLGGNRLTVRAAGLSASAGAELAHDGEAVNQDLVLAASGTVRGRIARVDGSPADQVAVVLHFGQRGGTTDRAAITTAADGVFLFTDIPVDADLGLDAVAIRFDGIVRRGLRLVANGQSMELGDLMLDEASPRVVSSSPAPGAAGVGAAPVIEVVFSESLDPASVTTDGILLRQGTNEIPVKLSLTAPAGETNQRLVRLEPQVRLRSQTLYTVLLIDQLPQATGGSHFGVRDLVGRLLSATAAFSFSTADNDPPLLISTSPAAFESQIEPVAPIRFAFNEPLRAGAVVTVTGPAGPVAGEADLVFGDQVVRFLPLRGLPTDGAFTASISNVFDLAGNPAANQPLQVTFRTLDTQGPEIARLMVVGGRPSVEGLPVVLEAQIANVAAGDRVRFTVLGSVIGSALASPFRIPFTLPASPGPVRLTATAADALGNEGPPAELLLNVVPNRAPTVNLSRELPAEGPVGSGLPYSFTVSAADELQISRMSVRVIFDGQELLVTNFPSGAVRTLTLVAPADLTAPGQIRIQAQARDELGLDSEELALELPVEPRSRPRIDVPVGMEVVAGGFTNAVFHVASLDGGLSELTVTDLVRLAAVTLPGFTNRLTFVPPVAETNVVVTVRASLVPGTNAFSLRAVDTNGLEAVVAIPVLVLPDLDGDGIADRDDPDIDGDGLDNARELALGTDPRKVDTDGDGLPDGVEILNGTNPLNVDTDGDGIPDGVDLRPLIPNQAPVPGPDSLRVGRNGSIEFTPSMLLVNDSDPENEGLEFVRVSPPVSGSVVAISPTVFRYSPALNFDGTDTFHYTIRDPHGLAAEVTVTVTVTTNRAPEALSDAVTVRQGDFISITLVGRDPENDPLGFTLRTLPAHGRLFQTTGPLSEFRGELITTVPILVNGLRTRVQYAPNPAFFGTDRIRFSVNDGELESIPAEVQFTVTENPLADSDGDGIPDRLDPDIDGDGLSNADEEQRGTDPRNPDTDGDGWPDGVEVEVGSDPLQASSTPQVYVIGESSVGLILPASPVEDLTIGGMAIAEPVVGLLLPSAPAGDFLTTELHLSEPTVQLLSPAAPVEGALELATLISEPVVALLLPGESVEALLDLGMQFSEPVVQMLIPAEPVGDLSPGGLVVSEPTVVVAFLNEDGSAPAGSGLGLRSRAMEPEGPLAIVLAPVLVRLLRLELELAQTGPRAAVRAAEDAGWNVILDWAGPEDRQYVVESSDDLEIWSVIPSEPLLAAGHFRARCVADRDDRWFYRVRLKP